MASIETNRPAAGLFAGNVSHFFARTFGAVADWNDARITRNALSKLTARELDDIGLTAGDIDAIAKRAAH